MAGRLEPPLEREVDHLRGEWGRPLQLVMFGDFECPFCRGAQSILRRVRERLGDELLFAFRHLPIPERHPLAPRMAEAAEAAAAQGAFWEFHDAAFARGALAAEVPLEIASELGLDRDRVAAELESGAWAERVRRDLDSARRSGATGTPAFFVNGVAHAEAYDASSLVDALRG